MNLLERLPVSEHIVEHWLENYIALQNAIWDEISRGSISKDSYLVDYLYDETDNKIALKTFQEEGR